MFAHIAVIVWTVAFVFDYFFAVCFDINAVLFVAENNRAELVFINFIEFFNVTALEIIQTALNNF